MTRVASPPSPDALVRSEMEVRTRDDGSNEVVTIEHYASVDGEWVNIRELIEAWRRR